MKIHLKFKDTVVIQAISNVASDICLQWASFATFIPLLKFKLSNIYKTSICNDKCFSEIA